MKLTLEFDNGEVKSFVMPRPKMKIIKELTQLEDKMRKGMDNDSFFELEGFIVRAFNNQFTVDELEDGLYSDELTPVLEQISTEIMGREVNFVNNTKTGKK